MTISNKSEALHRLADDLEARDEELAEVARRIARDLQKQPVEVVEQFSMLAKSPTIPDGWSWDDVNGGQNDPKFTGDLWGVRLKAGEPVLFQRGHVLFIRQADLYAERDRGYFERISRVPGQTVMVVWGRMGKREGFVIFDGGRMGPMIAGGADEIADWIGSWIKRAQAEPLLDWDRASEGL